MANEIKIDPATLRQWAADSKATIAEMQQFDAMPWEAHMVDIDEINKQFDAMQWMEQEEASRTVSERPPKASFRDLLQQDSDKKKDKYLAKLHKRIDGKGGKEVGLLLLRAWAIDKALSDKPTQAQVRGEFSIKGGWAGIHRYMNKENDDYIARAERLVL